jgi:hypothetical protein
MFRTASFIYRFKIPAVLIIGASLSLVACDNRSQPTTQATAAVEPDLEGNAVVPGPPPIEVAAEQMIHEHGYAWVVQTNVNPAERQLRVYEDGRELGPGGSMHEDIRNKGLGAYSHWDAGEWGYRVYFSTSDNSDPTKNSRKYELR